MTDYPTPPKKRPNAPTLPMTVSLDQSDDTPEKKALASLREQLEPLENSILDLAQQAEEIRSQQETLEQGLEGLLNDLQEILDNA